MFDLSTIELRKLIARIVFSLIGMLFIYYYINNLFISQLSIPVLVYPDLDNTYWLFLFLNIPQKIATTLSLAYCVDLSLVIFLLLSLYFWDKTIYPIVFLFIYIFYFITYNSFACHHYHHTGVLFIVLPFCFKDSAFKLMFEFVRYYLCFIYASAGCYKLFRGSVFNPDQMVEILRNTHLEALSNQSSGPILNFLLSNPSFSHFLFVLSVLFELFFIVGFITKKFDYLLFLILVLLKISLFIMMDFLAWELLILDVIMLPYVNKRIYN